MRSFKQWEIYWADVAFESDPSKSERCPILILADNLYVVLSTKITSHAPRKNYPEDYAIIEWYAAGLKKPSTLRAHRTLTIDKIDIYNKIGDLQPIDRNNVWNLIKDKKG